MSSLILLPRLKVENANTVAGLTYGFPAITHFLGFTHALSRQLSASHGLTLNGCAVICHHYQVHAYSSGRDYHFALTRNPLTREGNTASFNEEGRMHLTVSLLIECQGEIVNGEEGKRELAGHIQTLCQMQKLAGGTITGLEPVRVSDYPQQGGELRRLFYRLLPGFVLLDRSPWLAEHHQALNHGNPAADVLDAWLDFTALKMKAHAADDNQTPCPGDKAEWKFVPKPYPGYLVLLMTGYQRISPLYEPGEVANTRDPGTPFCFAEAVYGIGEWCGLHRIHHLPEIFWRYHTTEAGYYCRTEQQQTAEQPDNDIFFDA